MSYEIYDSDRYYARPEPPPPPPPRSNAGWIVAGVLGVLLVVPVMLVLICGFGGVLLALSPSSSPTPTPTATAGSSISSTSTPAPRQTVRPAGAPYSWQLPSGYVIANAPADLRGGTDYSTAAVLAPKDPTNILLTGSAELDFDAGTLSAAALRAGLDEVVTSIGHDPKTGRVVSVGSYSALRYDFDYAAAHAYSYFVFKGTVSVQVICRWSDKQQEITDGCDELLATLAID